MEMKIQTFISSLCMAGHTLIHVLTTTKQINKKLLVFYTTGITISLLNHHGKVYKCIMTIGACIDIYYITNPEEYFLFFIAICCYCIAKITRFTYFHSCAHVAVTVLHNTLLENTCTKYL